MSDDQKSKLNSIERANIKREAGIEKEHFLEEGYERIPNPERPSNFEKIKNVENREAAITETTGEGGDIISQGIYNQQQEERKKEIEKVLEKDLGDIYVSLPPEKQRQFKIVGEQTADAINDLFNKGKITIKKIVDLIRKWLSLIPGVNKFFLEQEIKIKADEILKIKNDNL